MGGNYLLLYMGHRVEYPLFFKYNCFSCCMNGARSKFWGVSGSEDRGGGDNSIQFINFGRVGDKSFKEATKIGGWKGG